MLLLDHLFEIWRFLISSSQFSNRTESQLRGKITFYYHSLEKGFLNNPIRPRFGLQKVHMLKKYLNIWLARNLNKSDSQFQSGCMNLIEYSRIHEILGVSVEDVISPMEIKVFENILVTKKAAGVVNFEGTDYFKYSHSQFDQFSNSRRSVRHFNREKVDKNAIEKAIALSNNSPSVCNRQMCHLMLIEDEIKIQDVLRLQGGLNATADGVRSLLVLMIDRSYLVAGKEWSQGYIDGGIYLQNLLYSLHFNRIAAVPLNWSKNFYDDKRIEVLLGLRRSSKVIALVAVGLPTSNFSVPNSLRKDVKEVCLQVN